MIALLVLAMQSTPPPPTRLNALVAQATHIVVASVRRVHDVRIQEGQLTTQEVIEADVARVLKGNLVGRTVFFPFGLWWRPDTTSIRVGDQAVVFLSETAKLPYSQYQVRELARVRGPAPLMAGILNSWGYFPVLGQRAVAAGGIILPIAASLWTPGDTRGPSVVSLESLLASIELAVGKEK